MKKSFELKLNELSQLKKNWDSYNGDVIGTPALTVAMLILTSLEEVGISDPDIIPTSEGGVSLEWTRGNSSEFSIHIAANGLLSDIFAYSTSGTYEAHPNTEVEIETAPS